MGEAELTEYQDREPELATEEHDLQPGKAVAHFSVPNIHCIYMHWVSCALDY